MSDGYYDKLAQTLDNTEKWDPITPGLIKKIFKTDSQNMSRIGNAIGWDRLEQDAKWNADNPSQGVARAATATGAGFAGAGIGNLLGGAGAYEAAIPAAGSEQSAMLAAQTGDFGAYGLGKTMQAASTADGLPWYEQAGAKYGGNLLSNVGKAGNQYAKKYTMDQAMGLMNPQQPQMPQRMPQGQQQPYEAQAPYGGGQAPVGGLLGMSEEEKRRLRMMGYQV